MSLLIQPKNKPAPQPATSLAEKTNGFKFQIPKVKSDAPAVDTPIVEAPVARAPDAKPVKSNANNLLIGKPKTQTPVATQPKPSTPIPQMSADKYEVVADSVPEFSEEAGNKFTQQLEMLQSAIDGNGVLKDQLENILTFLDDNPEYKENVSPQDVAVFVAGCRKVAGITVTEKTERKTQKTKVDASVEAVLDDLADLNFEL